LFSRFPASCAVAFPCLLAACSQSAKLDTTTTASIGSYSARDKECLARAMFFESNRSSREGLVAVGTVVMNRVESGEYPQTICGVVGQKNQFAPGVLTRKMDSKALPDVQAAAEAVLAGERHPAVHTARFFHQAGLTFPYKNMHYVLEAGGNAFYEKRSRRKRD
jgi:spore germination cell wall hydrolase CwlJ-like protein